jgi:transaldolase
MRYLLDTVNIQDIRVNMDIFPIAGITSNPSIVKTEGKIDFFRHMRKIRSLIGMQNSFHIQVTRDDVEGILKDADTILSRVDDQVYIKVPVTVEGIKAIRLLKQQGVHVTATAIYGKSQAFLALEAGADYLAPYYNRMENMGLSPDEVISSIAAMIEQYHYHSEILAASFKNAGQVERAFEAGAQTATVSPSILSEALEQPYILHAVEVFENDWKDIYGDKSISELEGC